MFMGKTKQSKEREKNEKIIRKILIGILCLCVVLISCLAVMFVKNDKSTKMTEDDNRGETVYTKDSRSESKLIYGGDWDTFQKLNYVVDLFWNRVRDEDYTYFWSDWNEDLLEYYNYSYTEEELLKYYDEIASKYHIRRKDPKFLNFAYEAVTYQNYGQYYLFTFKLGYSYYDDQGKIVTIAQTEQTFTLEPYTVSGATSYRVLDFDIRDIGLQYTRFATKGQSGTMVSPGIYKQDSTTQSTTQATTQSTTQATSQGETADPNDYKRRLTD